VRRALVLVAALAGPALAGERVDRPEFAASLAGAAEAHPWVPATIEVAVAARGGFHVNAEYPTSFTVAPAAPGVRYPRARLDGSSVDRLACEKVPAETCGLKLVVPYFVEKPGAYNVGGTVRFSVCDEERCLIEKVELSRRVTAR
jgi:hypothetical protein